MLITYRRLPRRSLAKAGPQIFFQAGEGFFKSVVVLPVGSRGATDGNQPAAQWLVLANKNEFVPRLSRRNPMKTNWSYCLMYLSYRDGSPVSQGR